MLIQSSLFFNYRTGHWNIDLDEACVDVRLYSILAIYICTLLIYVQHWKTRRFTLMCYFTKKKKKKRFTNVLLMSCR